MESAVRATAARLVATITLSLAAGLAPVHAAPSAQAAARTVQNAQALFERGIAAANQNNNKRALAIYGQIAQRYGKGSPPAARTLAARALLNTGAILGERGDTWGAIAAYHQIDQRFGQDTEPATREVVASALVSKAEALYRQGNLKTAADTYKQLGKRFGKDDSGFIRQLVSITKWRRAEILADDRALSSSSRRTPFNSR
jgi:tetratricopeptide (TPR) repeat protein